MITADEVRKVLDYNPATGDFIWKVPPSRSVKAGSIAGSKCRANCKTYIRITYEGVRYYAHRLAFLYMNGEWPKHQGKHLDGNGCANMWSNLSDEPPSIVSKNRKLQDNNTSGVNGVYWSASHKKWRVAINHNGKIISGGIFKNKPDAMLKRLQLNEEYGYSVRHGENRPLY